MKSYFVFNGKRSLDYGLTIENLPNAAFPARRGEEYLIDGRNGKRFREDGTFDNYEQIYNVFVRDEATKRDLYQISTDLAAWLLGSSGFCRLEDSYNPDSFRLARFAGPMNFEATLRRYGRASLVFDCQPERYLKTGEEAITLFENVDLSDSAAVSAAQATIINPTAFPSKPLLRVTGTGNVGFSSTNAVNSETMIIQLALGSTERTVSINCDTYRISLNSALVSFGTTYPILTTLQPGENTFAATSGITNPGTIKKLEIVPKWWTL